MSVQSDKGYKGCSALGVRFMACFVSMLWFWWGKITFKMYVFFYFIIIIIIIIIIYMFAGGWRYVPISQLRALTFLSFAWMGFPRATWVLTTLQNVRMRADHGFPCLINVSPLCERLLVWSQQPMVWDETVFHPHPDAMRVGQQHPTAELPHGNYAAVLFNPTRGKPLRYSLDW